MIISMGIYSTCTSVSVVITALKTSGTIHFLQLVLI